MNKMFVKVGICFFVMLGLLFSIAGCGNKTAQTDSQTKLDTAAKTEQVKTEAKKEKVKIKFPTFRVGTNTSAPVYKEFIRTFEEQYGDEIELVIEQLPSDNTYIDKMRVLAASGDVPDIVDGKSGNFDLYVKSGFAIDLMPYLDADPEWKTDIGEDAIKVNSRDDKLYSITNEGVALVGYFYNKAMFEKAGIQPAKTWDEFLSNCDKLKASGVIPLSLMTGENSWTTNLLLASIIGTSGAEGNAAMNAQLSKTIPVELYADGLKKVQTLLQKYTTKDAIGAIYANAANSFMHEKTAIMPNGPWMIGDFSNPEKANPGFDKKVGCAIYPEGGVFASYWEGYMVCSKDKEHADAAVKFVKHITGANAQLELLKAVNAVPISPRVEIPEDFMQNNPILMELISASKDAKYKYRFLDSLVYPNVLDSFRTLYPELAFGKTTPEEMAKKLQELTNKN